MPSDEAMRWAREFAARLADTLPLAANIQLGRLDDRQDIAAAATVIDEALAKRDAEIARIVHENGPVVIDMMGDGLAWRPLDYGTWTVLGATPHA